METLRRDADELSSTIAQVSPSIVPSIDEDLLDDEEREKLKSKSIEALDLRIFAEGWLSLDPSRKTTKRQVMTLPYGPT